ncbi:MAG: hypothetical protein Ct9H300mP1_27480 [Planctomycetaceae bacterium]|nr:MAG: hypothetical protein Ct9H300mP1_27480 [Planctomycetaceae bacterium]
MYCLASGLLAVVYTDLLQSFLIIGGAVILLPLGIQAGGGLEAFFDPERMSPDKWVMWRPSGPDAGTDYLTILMLFVLGLPYWFTSQYMLQRSFAGKTVHEARKGAVVGGGADRAPDPVLHRAGDGGGNEPQIFQDLPAVPTRSCRTWPSG